MTITANNISDTRPSGSLPALMIAMLLLASGCTHIPDPIDESELPTNTGGTGGGGEEPVPCDPNTVYFQQQILPLLISNCTMDNGCHATATDDNDWIALTSYGAIMGSGVVQDGDLWEAINDDDPDKLMPRPPQAPLTPEQIAMIGTWIQQGAQNNNCADGVCDTLNVTYSGTIRPIIQARCQGCHSGSMPQGGLDYTSWSVLNAVANDGRLAGAIQHLPTFASMPPNGPALPDCKVQQFLAWIDAGAPNN